MNPFELFYINEEAKTRGQITKLDIENFDKIKKDLGGVIIALDKLNYADKVCFVEGDDDINYLELLKDRIVSIDDNFIIANNVVYYYLRGKDNLLSKVEYHKRFMSQLFRDKSIFVIYDKDFSTETNSILLNEQVKRKSGRNSDAYFHNGYCIESILFSDQNILIDFLSSFYSTNDLRTEYFVIEYFDSINEAFRDINSSLYINLAISI